MSEKENGVINTSVEHQVVNKKRKWKFIIGGILVLIAIAIGLYIGYQKLNSNPITIYKNVINEAYDLLSDTIKESKNSPLSNLNIEKDPIVINIDAKLESDMEELKNFSGLNYNFSVGMDYNNKKANIEAGIKEGNTEIINALLSIIDNKMYLKSEDLFAKVIDLGEYDFFDELNLEELNNFNLSYENIEYILKEMKTIFIDSLNQDKFTLEEEKLTINDKEYNAKKVIYSLDKENMERTSKYIADSILKDEKLLKAIAECTGLTTTEIKEELEDIDLSDYEDITIVLYSDKLNNLIAGSIYQSEEQIIKFSNVDDLLDLAVESDNDKLTIIDKKEYVEFKVYDDTTEIISLNIYENKDDIKIEYKLDIEGSLFSGVIELSNLEMKDNKETGDFKISVKTSVIGKEINISLAGSYSFAKAEVNVIDTTNSVSIDSLTEEETLEIYNKLAPIMVRFGLIGEE